MRYASIEDMALAIGSDTLRAIGDHDGDRIADDPVVLRALDEASALAESYIPREISPHINPASIPPALRAAVVAIADHRLRRVRNQANDDSREAHAEAIRWLERLSSGTTSLGIDVPPGTDDGSSIAMSADPEAEGQPRLWNRTSSSRVF